MFYKKLELSEAKYENMKRANEFTKKELQLSQDENFNLKVLFKSKYIIVLFYREQFLLILQQ